MLKLTEFNGHTVWLNPDQLQRMEARPDTVLTLTNGDKILVRETPEQLVRLFERYKQRIHTAPEQGESV
jgi:flagellar protein FlbD